MTQQSLSWLLPVLGIVVPLVGGVVTWALNERSKRMAEEYRRKDERYAELVGRVRAFSADGDNAEKRSEFLDQLNLAWLYCSDEVIRAAYAFLDSVHVDAREVGSAHDARKRAALGALVAAIRRDLIARKPLRKTALTAQDFKLLSSR